MTGHVTSKKKEPLVHVAVAEEGFHRVEVVTSEVKG
jgi:hypothetical protein